MYESEITDLIYAATGCIHDDDDIIVHVRDTIREYLSNIKKNAEIYHKKNASLKTRDKPFSTEDIFSILKGSPEHYGARRCLILKVIGKKITSLEKIQNVEEEEEEEEEEVNVPDIDLLQTELMKLNDGTEEYSRFNMERLMDLKKADDLTVEMDIDEYQIYNKCAHAAFVKEKPNKFCEWLGWKKKPNSKILSVFGWLAGNKVKRIIHEALEKRKQRISTLQGPFVSTWDIYDKLYPLLLQDFTCSNKTENTNIFDFYQEKYSTTKKKKNVFEFLCKRKLEMGKEKENTQKRRKIK